LIKRAQARQREAARTLDADHLRSHIRQHHAAVRAGDEPPEVEHPDIVEHRLHARTSTFAPPHRPGGAIVAQNAATVRDCPISAAS
jgi:hypothetical protein